MDQQVQQEVFLTLWWRFDQLDQISDLWNGQGQGRDTKCGAFCDMFTIGLKHDLGL
jgi:hypothetical protein